MCKLPAPRVPALPLKCPLTAQPSFISFYSETRNLKNSGWTRSAQGRRAGPRAARLPPSRRSVSQAHPPGVCSLSSAKMLSFSPQIYPISALHYRPRLFRGKEHFNAPAPAFSRRLAAAQKRSCKQRSELSAAAACGASSPLSGLKKSISCLVTTWLLLDQLLFSLVAFRSSCSLRSTPPRKPALSK